MGVVGLGLIGGSIGLDLMALGVDVRGLVHRQATAERARQRGLARQVSTDPGVLTGCALVLLALPLDQLLDPSPDLLAALPKEAVIADLASVKAPVLAAWEPLVPRFVATHPMAGTAAAGVEAGLPNLFCGPPWVATPTRHTDPEALAQIRALAAQGVAVLMVEQNARGALRQSDRGYVLAEGRNHVQGPAAALLDDPAVAAAFLGGRMAQGTAEPAA